jgi:hypothetical protein
MSLIQALTGFSWLFPDPLLPTSILFYKIKSDPLISSLLEWLCGSPQADVWAVTYYAFTRPIVREWQIIAVIFIGLWALLRHLLVFPGLFPKPLLRTSISFYKIKSDPLISFFGTTLWVTASWCVGSNLLCLHKTHSEGVLDYRGYFYRTMSLIQARTGFSRTCPITSSRDIYFIL